MPALNHKNTGFTLVELVIGIAVFSVVMTIVIGLIAPQASRSADPIFKVRAAELAQSMFNEILGKSFDENSDRVGGQIRCDERQGDQLSDPLIPGALDCTAEGNFGPDKIDPSDPSSDNEARAEFDDVDDYNGLTSFQDSLGRDLAIQYDGYTVQVTVEYDGDMDNDGTDDANTLAERRAKRIEITVIVPNGEQLSFAAYRSNF